MTYIEHTFSFPWGQIALHDVPWTQVFFVCVFVIFVVVFCFSKRTDILSWHTLNTHSFSSKGQISLHAVPLKHMSFFSFLFFSPKERYPFMAYLKDAKFFVPDALSITRIGQYRNCRYPVALVKLFVKILTRSARHYVQHFPTQWTPVERRGEKTPVILMCTLSVSSLLNW